MSKIKQIPVGISGRHVHLSINELEILFGKDYQLTKFKDLSQPNQYASNEKVDVISPSGNTLSDVRILGPLRKKPQIEISNSDAIRNKFIAPIRSSGNTAGSGACTLVGPKGKIELKEGVIIADRHIHFSTQEASEYGVTDGQKVMIRIHGEKSGILENILCRVDDLYKLDCHLDTDDGAAFSLKNGDLVDLITEIKIIK